MCSWFPIKNGHPWSSFAHHNSNPNNAFFRGNPSNSPYICIVWSTNKWEIQWSHNNHHFFWDRQKATSFGTSFEFCMERSCSENKTFQIYLVSLQVYLEPETSVYKWLFQLDDSKSLHKKWLFHQTSIKKMLFRVPSVDGFGSKTKISKAEFTPCLEGFPYYWSDCPRGDAVIKRPPSVESSLAPPRCQIHMIWRRPAFSKGFLLWPCGHISCRCRPKKRRSGTSWEALRGSRGPDHGSFCRHALNASLLCALRHSSSGGHAPQS